MGLFYANLTVLNRRPDEVARALASRPATPPSALPLPTTRAEMKQRVDQGQTPEALDFLVDTWMRTIGEIRAALLSTRALVTPEQSGAVVVYDEPSEHDTKLQRLLGAHLSATLGAAVLAVSDHDDAVLAYWLFDRGVLADQYNSRPDYFESATEREKVATRGDAAKLGAAFEHASAHELERVLRSEDFAWEVDRHEALVKALGTSRFSVGIGFGRVSKGELPEGLAAAQLLQVS